MKKIVSFLFGALMLIGFTACENNLDVTDENIVGKWELIQMVLDGGSNPGDGQIWEFTADHKMYQSMGSEKVDAGKWQLNDKELKLDFIPFPMTVSKLTSDEMVLDARDPESKIVMFSYEFEKVK